MAAAAGAWLKVSRRHPDAQLVVVEPSVAACIRGCIMKQGSIEAVPNPGYTEVQGCNCEKASVTAWETLRQSPLVCVTVDDSLALRACSALQEEGLCTSPTGACGVAGAMAMLNVLPGLSRHHPAIPALTPRSRILVINTEDDKFYRHP